MKTRFFVLSFTAALVSFPCIAQEHDGDERHQAVREEHEVRVERIERERPATLDREGRRRELQRDQEHLERERHERDESVAEETEILERRVQVLQEEFNELRQSGRGDAAERIQRELQKVRLELAKRQQDPFGPELRRRIETRRQEIEALHRQGRHEEAERMEMALRELEVLRPGRPEEPGERPRAGWTEFRPDAARIEPDGEERPGDHAEGPDGEASRRMHHLRLAIENLHQAGLHDQANRLENAVREMGGMNGRRGGGPMGPKEPRNRMEQGMPPAMREMHEALRQMQGQMEEMRRAMEEMRRRMEPGPERR